MAAHLEAADELDEYFGHFMRPAPSHIESSTNGLA